MRGGYREGAGRKAGVPNKRTQELQERVASEGITPLDYLLAVMRDETQDLKTRIDAACAAAPYVHPKLAAVKHQSDEENTDVVIVHWTNHYEEDAA